MITGIKLKNWRCHLDSDLTFSKGTNALVGRIGSGKSSILNAICFGLFGTFPDLQAKKIKLDDIIMNKPSSEDTTEITIHFTIDGKEYFVMRVIERGKGTTYSELREGEKLLDSPNSQRVTESLEKILKVNYELFSKAIYSEQNGLDYFLRLPRGERMKRVDNLLMIDKFEKARSSAITLRNKLIDRKVGKQSIVGQTVPEEVNRVLKNLEKELKELNDKKLDVSKELKDLIEKRRSVEKELHELEVLDKSLINLDREKKSLEAAIEENKTILREIEKIITEKKPKDVEKKIEETKKKIKELEEELENKRNQHERLTDFISEQRTRMNFIQEDKIKNLEKNIEQKLEVKKRLTEMEKSYGKDPSKTLEKEEQLLEEQKQRITTLLTRLEETKTIIESIRELKDNCPVCHSELTEEKRRSLLKEQTQKLTELEKDLVKIKKEENLKEKQITKLGEIVESFKKGSSELADLGELQSQLKTKKKVLTELEKIVKNKQTEDEELKKELSGIYEILKKKVEEKQELESLFSRLSEFESKKLRVTDLTSKEKKVEQDIQSTKKKIGERDLDTSRFELREMISKESKLEEKLNSLSDIITEKGERRKEQEEKIKLIEKQKKEILNLENTIKDLRIFEKAVERTQVQLRKEFVDTVNFTMNNIWPNLYPYGDFLGIRLGIEERDYVLQLKDRSDRWVDVEGIASGGERSISCLALRIAFSLVLAPQLKLLILDEPTHNLDTRSVEDLSETLRTRVGDFMEQSFIITHDKNLENAVTGELYNLSRDKETDGITKIERIIG